MASTIREPRQATLSRRARWAGGQPISRLMTLTLDHPELISLAAGFVDSTSLPDGAAREAIEAVLADTGRARAALQYGPTAGQPQLREMVVDRVRESNRRLGRETCLAVDQTVIASGSNQLLHLAAEALVDPGDIVLCAAPTYFVFLGTLANLGARSIGIPSDDGGMIPEALDEALARLDGQGELARVKAVYLTSYFDNPCSRSLAADRRGPIVEVAQRWSREGKIYLIDDTAYRELRYTAADLPSLRAYDAAGDTVIETGTFSKSFAPGIRVGWGFLPRPLVAPVCELKGNVDFGAPSFAQHVMVQVLRRGLFDRHVERLRTVYRAKLDALLDAAGASLGNLAGVRWIRPAGGLYVWVTLPESIDAGPDGPLLERAVEAGVLYVPGQYCFPAEGPCHRNTMRLSFGTASVDQIRLGVGKLAEAIRAAMSSKP